jgi:hypothetical protein
LQASEQLELTLARDDLAFGIPATPAVTLDDVSAKLVDWLSLSRERLGDTRSPG